MVCTADHTHAVAASGTVYSFLLTEKGGAALPDLKVTPDRYLTVRYAGASGDFNPIHIDANVGRSVGYSSEKYE